MKIRTATIFIILSLIASIPCYADSPTSSEKTVMMLILLLVIAIGAIFLGIIIKILLNIFKINVSNWLIFTTATILAGLIFIMLFYAR
jgi:hypothetical protein